MKQKISGLRGTKHIWGRDARPKIGSLNKPMHANSWLTPSQVLFLTWLPELKTYSCLISQSCVTWLILIQWAGEGMCRMEDSKKNQDNLDVSHHHHPYHPHHRFTVYAHAIHTWLYHLIDQNYTNIPASIILSSFSNYQILGQLMEQPLQGPRATSYLHGTCPARRRSFLTWLSLSSAGPLWLPRWELGTASFTTHSENLPVRGARRMVFRCCITPNK